MASGRDEREADGGREEPALSDSAVGYELEPEPEAPPLPGETILRADAHDLISALAADLLIHAKNCVRAFGDVHLALSGGSTPMPLYNRLMTDPLYRDFPWGFAHLWIVDERRVPVDDERSNFKHIAEYLVGHSDIPDANVHPIRALDDGCDESYERELQQALAWREKGHDRLDFVLLGMGADGHTASLFPHSPALAERSRLVRINAGPTVTPPERVTMTYPLLNASRFAAVLVTGSGKREALARVSAAHQRAESNGGADAQVAAELPILGVRPTGGVLRWYVDGEACGVET
jgi:6-phosphogluconolactonase